MSLHWPKNALIWGILDTPRTFLCRLGSVGVMCAVQVCCLGPARALTEQKTVDLVIGSYRRHEKIGALCLFFSQQ